ncbi:MAG TPA: hypothetical protein VM032_02580 [Vicinamibacterales bacterium]|nr:hypothetical protein [Vicinamibacterales bacterium]
MAKRSARTKTPARKPAARRTARPSGAKAKKSAARAVAPRKNAPAAGTRTPAAKKRAPATAPLVAPIKDTVRRTIGRVQLDVGRAGAARVKRMIYPAGFHWAKDMKPVTGTDLCMHAHVGFLAQGEIHIEYADGCVVELRAPQVVAIDPGHDGWVVGTEPVVMIEFDFERDTVSKLGMPTVHRHE